MSVLSQARDFLLPTMYALNTKYGGRLVGSDDYKGLEVDHATDCLTLNGQVLFFGFDIADNLHKIPGETERRICVIVSRAILKEAGEPMKIYTPDQYIAGLRDLGIVVYEMMAERIRTLNPNGIPSGCFAETDGLIPEHDLRYTAGYGTGEPKSGVSGLVAKTAANATAGAQFGEQRIQGLPFQSYQQVQEPTALQSWQQSIPGAAQSEAPNIYPASHLARAELMLLIEHHADSNPTRVAELAKLLKAAT